MPISFRPTIKPLWAFFPICGFVFLFVLAPVALVTFIYPESFAATATVIVTQPEGRASLSNSPQTEALEVSSTAVVEKTVQALNLQAVWGKKYNNGGLLYAPDCIALLKSRLEITVIKPNSLQIRAFSDNADEAANLANGVVEAYRDFRRETDLQAGGAPDVRSVTILDHANPDYRPVRPNKVLNLTVGALVGILAGAIVASIILGIFASLRRKWNVAGLPQKA